MTRLSRGSSCPCPLTGPINLVTGEGVHYHIDHEKDRCPESQQCHEHQSSLAQSSAVEDPDTVCPNASLIDRGGRARSDVALASPTLLPLPPHRPENPINGGGGPLPNT